MSRQALRPPSMVPRSSRTSASRLPATSSKTKAAKAPSQTTKPDAPKEFTLPALSTTYAPVLTETELDKLRKKTIRRNAPQGEDLKEIKRILRTVKGQDVTVQEFIGLVAPYTGDNGAAMRDVLSNDLASFRNLARKVYEMITRDNSDVLLNQQMELAEYYKERKALLQQKMMAAIDEIYSMAPVFDFDRYGKEKDKYLLEIFPLPEELKVEPEELEMMKRQEAYHRLQWLRSEGERLNAENNSLKQRLRQMKRLLIDEQQKAAEIARMAEMERQKLEAAEAEKQDTLDFLSESLEKKIIAREMAMRKKADRGVLAPKRTASTASTTKKSAGGAKKRQPTWNEEQAAEIDLQNIEETVQGEFAKVTKGQPRPKRRKPKFVQLAQPQPSDPNERQTSPFHYSPPRTPPEAPAGPQFFDRRQVAGPSDSWTGFG